MDDRNFGDPADAQEWLEGIESVRARIRDQDLYPRLSAWVRKVAPDRILDIGCGQGICSEHISLKGRCYVGVDPSPHLLERARELYASADRTFVPGDAYALPFTEASFDAAFSIQVWHLLAEPEKAAGELCRVLKPGAHFLLITANPDGYSLWTSRYERTRIEGQLFEGYLTRPDGTELRDIFYLRSLDEVLASLRAAGLEVERHEAFREREGGLRQLLSIEGRKPR